MSPHLNLFLGKMDFEFSVSKRDHPDFHQQQKQKQTSVTVYECINANSTGDWHMCEGTIDTEAYIGMVQRYILPSR